MNVEQYRDYCIAKKGVTESIPFSKLPDLLVFKVMGKMFTAADISEFEGFTVKYHPDSIEELREKYVAVQKPPYMSPKHWNMVLLDGSIPDNLLYEWLDISYDLVVAKLPKKVREELLG